MFSRYGFMVVALILGLLFACGCDGHDDDDSGDDSHDDPGDDDTGDDDDDTGDDDDYTPPDPYDGMTPAGKTVGDILGIASHMSTGSAYSPTRNYEIEKSVEAGVSLVRRGFYWNNIEPADDAWYFDGYDELVGLVKEAGLSPMAMLTRAVSWATPTGSPSDVDPALFADFTGTVAARYADDIRLYEIWNEQNTSRFWKPEVDPEHYGNLLKAAHQAIHENDPDAEVIFGGLSPLNEEDILNPLGIWAFIADVGEYHPDLCDFIDGVAIHPYTFLQQPGPEASVDLGVYSYPDLQSSIEEARGLLAMFGCYEKPIHFTEIGWPSLIIGVERQAAYFPRSVLLSSAAGVAGYYWYTFYDEEPDSTIPTEDYFGLYQYPGEEEDHFVPKPSFLAMNGLNKIVGTGRYAGDLAQVLLWPEEKYALAFADDDGKWTIALWRSGWNFDVEVIVDVPIHSRAQGAWTLYDQDGVELSSGDSGTMTEVTVAISGRVKYLQFHVVNPEM